MHGEAGGLCRAGDKINSNALRNFTLAAFLSPLCTRVRHAQTPEKAGRQRSRLPLHFTFNHCLFLRVASALYSTTFNTSPPANIELPLSFIIDSASLGTRCSTLRSLSRTSPFSFPFLGAQSNIPGRTFEACFTHPMALHGLGLSRLAPPPEPEEPTPCLIHSDCSYDDSSTSPSSVASFRSCSPVNTPLPIRYPGACCLEKSRCSIVWRCISTRICPPSALLCCSRGPRAHATLPLAASRLGFWGI